MVQSVKGIQSSSILIDIFKLGRILQSSQWSQNIIIETGHNQDQLNTRHTINVIVNNKKRKYQQKYREQNRGKLKQREVEWRKRIQYSLSIAGPSTCSNINRIKSNNEEIIAAISQCSSGLERTQSSCIRRNEQAKGKNTPQKKREYLQRYREQNREKLKQREAERRRRLQNAKIMTQLSTPSNIEFTKIINEPIIDEINANSRNVDGLENMQHLFVECAKCGCTQDLLYL
ncbi:hypothetical protein PV327_001603 [Microctonus hyperodae]|uniref:Uncharacterized protein n=1 Tax=Microctonus hyperodae TaxID=165561 RepID=A0AA39FDU0_MICHY|nr:hypothetical protein PV327_001603 [Microctonus hyperodae]